MTTNGARLSELAAPLFAAGLAGLTVSIDSLDPVRFREITHDDLDLSIGFGITQLVDGFTCQRGDIDHPPVHRVMTERFDTHTSDPYKNVTLEVSDAIAVNSGPTGDKVGTASSTVESTQTSVSAPETMTVRTPFRLKAAASPERKNPE